VHNQSNSPRRDDEVPERETNAFIDVQHSRAMLPTLNISSALQPIPLVAAGTSIPKIIHQVYISRALPPVLQANVDRIRALNPGWEYRFYDDGEMVDFIASAYGERALAYYNRINRKYGASRADFFRYLLLYKVGGIYLDIKSSLEKPLDHVLRPDDMYLLSRWRNVAGGGFEGWGLHDQLKSIGGEEFQQWHIIAAPGHPFLRAVIERVMRNIDVYNPVFHGTGKQGVLRVTGPIAYTQSIVPLLDRHRHRLVDSQDDLGLVYSIFGADNKRAHKSVFTFHYTALNEPVTSLTGIRKFIWHMCGPVQNQVIQPIRRVAEALSRRITAKPLRRG
jgi:inositol phosphorylceramide mannosyltransferase catalytic subunit